MNYLVRAGLAIAAMAALALGMWRLPADQLSWPAIFLVTAAALAAAYVLLSMSTGYRRLSPHVVAEIRGRSIWHLTSSPLHANGYLELDVVRCRRRAMVLRSDQPWLRPQRAVYVFRSKPTAHDRWRNVSKSRALHIYELDGADLPVRLLGRDNELAVPGRVRARVLSYTTSP